MNLRDESLLKPASGLCTQRLSNGRVAAWNRFAPVPMILNADFEVLFRYLGNTPSSYSNFRGRKRLIRKLVTNNILAVVGTEDHELSFSSAIDAAIKNICKVPEIHLNEELPYHTLTIINHTCNLQCSYCVVEKVRDNSQPNIHRTSDEKLHRLYNIVDQFMSRRQGKGISPNIFFNGGEILLQFPVIKGIVTYLKERYPNEKVTFGINTNATLVTEEIAQFLTTHFQTISISIDGYKDNSDITRRYHNGKGSFHDIIRGVEFIRKYIPKNDFQGTLTPNSYFDISRLQELKAFGFVFGRLGVDLLSITPEQARDMAKLHFDIMNETKGKEVEIKESFYKLFSETVRKEIKTFNYPCSGLSDKYGRFFHYNLDIESGNLLCSFITATSVQMADTNFDIYHRAYFDKGATYLRQRYESYKQHCLGCELVAVCRGGCIMKGLDAFNQKNESACAFLKVLWNYFIEALGDIPERVISTKSNFDIKSLTT